MPKQSVLINFAKGLNQKVDPWQLPIGNFESLINSVFQKIGLLQKRNGYGLLTESTPTSSYITTLNGNLTSIGSTVNAYSSSLQSWITKGTLQPCSLSVLPLIRNSINQTQADTAIANGLVLTVFTETNGTTVGTTTQYLFAIADQATGQNIVEPSSIPVLSSGAISGSSRAYVIGNYFLIVNPVTVSGTTFLQYVSLSTSNPVNADNTPNVSAAQNVTSDAYVPILSNPGWDGVAVNSASNNYLTVAYNTTTGAQGVHVATLAQSQIALGQASSTILAFAGATNVASILSIGVDLTSSPNIFYIFFWNSNTTNAYICAVYTGLGSITQQFAPTLVLAGTSVANLALAAQNNLATLFWEQNTTYSYDATISTQFVGNITCTSTGTIGGSLNVSVRSLGLASKAFIVNGVIYFMGAYQSPYQPTYFLINASLSSSASPVVVAKLAYQNGGGYLTLGLPNVSVSNQTAQIPYLYKDLVESLNTQNNTQQTNGTVSGVYSQTGVNLASFDLATVNISTAEIASNLHISGGFLSHYDGYLPVEHNFFLFPDSIECTWNASSAVTPTGTFSSGSKTVTVSSATGIYPGMTITDTTNSSYIPAGTSVVYVSGTTVTISQATMSAGSGDSLSIQGNIAAVPSGGTMGAQNYFYIVTYEWTDNQGLAYRSGPSIAVGVTTSGSGNAGIITVKGPMLRLTQKIANKVKIVVYRWSENTEAYNQVTSITAPILNDTTVDSFTFVDTLPDSSVVGNNLLYTTGGVVSDTNAPASNILTLFDTRLWTLSSENPNTWYVSKQAIPGTPVENSSDFTVNVSPTTGTESSLGNVTAGYAMDDKLINFFETGIYYINGTGPDNLGTTPNGCSLGQYSQPIFITSSVGCSNQKSIVLTPNGLMFQSNKGIWLLGRDLSTTYIGAAVEDYNQYTVTSANVIPDTNYVLFTLNTGQFLMYDYYFNQWGSFEGVQGVSSCIYEDLHTVLDQFGRILQETPGQYLDVNNPVLMSFTTSWINMASLQGYERFYEFYFLARFLSPHSLMVQVAYDYNSSPLNAQFITPQNFSASTPAPFGVPVPFGSPGDREQWRVHAKQQLCQSFQLTVNEIFNPAYQTIAGAGFTMSGLTCLVDVKRSTRPISAKLSTGLE